MSEENIIEKEKKEMYAEMKKMIDAANRKIKLEKREWAKNEYKKLINIMEKYIEFGIEKKAPLRAMIGINKHVGEWCNDDEILNIGYEIERKSIYIVDLEKI
ncbi:hypothetical protein [Niveispirillum sp. BGYR6]|uniref:hypothetical protein n=1 Tax=Niveispirillum sp. BGYR6 TaxID=2971249 RepID=UPI0022B95CFA|nr:hypothetical protein [Niveispirillum sp. BGYR6]MDG5493414.1 hypothetical protein [Niveispirillum sp. BGYR6]